ncbi:MAG TPA: CDP-alcohol phosphatidyltransferase family protein [Galbitalea sp.]|jgi:cardiolipin synthase
MAGTDRIQVSSRILTIPNFLSLCRLAMVPVFLVFIIVGADFAALIVLVVSSVTDYLDGTIARKFHQVTRLGQLLDPAADRLFIFAALVGLCVRGILPLWLVVIIIGRDFMLVILGIVLANHGYGPLPVHHLGKMGTFALLFALPILMLGLAFHEISWITNPVGWAFGLWGAFLYWWAGFVYILETARVIRIPLGASPAASDTLGG